MIENYESLPLGVYLKIDSILKDENRDALSMQVGVLSLLSGKTEDEIMNLSLEEYSEMAGKSLFLQKPNTNVPKVRKYYRVDDMMLVPVEDYRKLTAGQYIDFQHYTQTEGLDFVGLLSVLLVPKGCRYNEGYDVLEVRSAVEKMCVPDAFALTAFFFKRFVQLIRVSLTYSKQEVKKMKGTRRKEMEARISRAEKLMRIAGVG